MTAPPSFQPLFEAAKAARERAYAPYSHYKVGAAVRADDGTIYAACNVENAVLPAGRCAEGNAIGMMIAGGGRRVLEVVVVGGEAGAPDLITPCGICRQVIREFAALDIAIHSADPKGHRQSFTLNDLLPNSFGPDNLKERA